MRGWCGEFIFFALLFLFESVFIGKGLLMSGRVAVRSPRPGFLFTKTLIFEIFKKSTMWSPRDNICTKAAVVANLFVRLIFAYVVKILHSS